MLRKEHCINFVVELAAVFRLSSLFGLPGKPSNPLLHKAKREIKPNIGWLRFGLYCPQNPVGAIPCGFDSHLRHQVFLLKISQLPSALLKSPLFRAGFFMPLVFDSYIRCRYSFWAEFCISSFRTIITPGYLLILPLNFTPCLLL